MPCKTVQKYHLYLTENLLIYFNCKIYPFINEDCTFHFHKLGKTFNEVDKKYCKAGQANITDKNEELSQN